VQDEAVLIDDQAKPAVTGQEADAAPASVSGDSPHPDEAA